MKMKFSVLLGPGLAIGAFLYSTCKAGARYPRNQKNQANSAEPEYLKYLKIKWKNENLPAGGGGNKRQKVGYYAMVRTEMCM